MEIRSIKTAVLRVPLSRPVGDSQNLVESWWLLVVTVETDAGITGWGYNAGIGPALKAVKVLIDEAIAPHLVGEDPFLVNELWQRYYYKPHFTGEMGVSFQGVAAVEIALWDAIAKYLGQPLWRLLGAAGPRRTPAYTTDAGWLSLPLSELVERARRAVDEGFAGVKIKVGSEDPALDYRRVEAVRAAVGVRPRLMIDANCRWDLNTALKWGRRMEALDLSWLEEPLDAFDIPGHAALAAGLTLPVMIGESITSLHMFRDYVAARAVDILQPDALKLGGISAWREAACLARIQHLPVVPAVWDMMQVNAHLCATIPHALMTEYIPWILHIFKVPVRFKDGFLLAPDEPGIGTEIKPEAMERYAVS